MFIDHFSDNFADIVSFFLLSLSVPLSPVPNHLICYIGLKTDGTVSTRTAPCAAFSATRSIPCKVIRTRTISTIGRNGFLNDSAFDLLVGHGLAPLQEQGW